MYFTIPRNVLLTFPKHYTFIVIVLVLANPDTKGKVLLAIAAVT